MMDFKEYLKEEEDRKPSKRQRRTQRTLHGMHQRLRLGQSQELSRMDQQSLARRQEKIRQLSDRLRQLMQKGGGDSSEGDEG